MTVKMAIAHDSLILKGQSEFVEAGWKNSVSEVLKAGINIATNNLSRHEIGSEDLVKKLEDAKKSEDSFGKLIDELSQKVLNKRQEILATGQQEAEQKFPKGILIESYKFL